MILKDNFMHSIILYVSYFISLYFAHFFFNNFSLLLACNDHLFILVYYLSNLQMPISYLQTWFTWSSRTLLDLINKVFHNHYLANPKIKQSSNFLPICSRLFILLNLLYSNTPISIYLYLVLGKCVVIKSHKNSTSN